MTVDATTTREDEEAMIAMLGRLVKLPPVFMSEQSDEEAVADPDDYDDDETVDDTPPPVKAEFHGSHDQSTHGNWARGGGIDITTEDGWSFTELSYEHMGGGQYSHDKWGAINKIDADNGRDLMPLPERMKVVEITAGPNKLNVRFDYNGYGRIEAYEVHSEEFWRNTANRHRGPIGYIDTWKKTRNGKEVQEVLGIGVSPAWQGNGVATEMWKFGKEQIPNIAHSLARTEDGQGWIESLERQGLAADMVEFHGNHDQSTHGNWSDGGGRGDRTGYPEMDAVIDEFLVEIGDLTCDDVHGYCQEISEQFVDFAKARGIENIYATNTDLDEMGYEIQPGSVGGEMIDQDGNFYTGHYPEHTVNTYYPPGGPSMGVVIDFTARQYGYDTPVKVTFAATTAEFHGNHDQSTHGNWARGGSAAVLGEPQTRILNIPKSDTHELARQAVNGWKNAVIDVGVEAARNSGLTASVIKRVNALKEIDPEAADEIRESVLWVANNNGIGAGPVIDDVLNRRIYEQIDETFSRVEPHKPTVYATDGAGGYATGQTWRVEGRGDVSLQTERKITEAQAQAVLGAAIEAKAAGNISSPINLRVASTSTAYVATGDDRVAGWITSNDPTTVNIHERAFAPGTVFTDPASQRMASSAHVDDLRWITMHEIGHSSYFLEQNSASPDEATSLLERSIDLASSVKPNGWSPYMSAYGATKSVETHAEAFAEWVNTGGGNTTNPIVAAYAAEFGWKVPADVGYDEPVGEFAVEQIRQALAAGVIIVEGPAGARILDPDTLEDIAEFDDIDTVDSVEMTAATVEFHGNHDQSSHGNWASGGSASTDELVDEAWEERYGQPRREGTGDCFQAGVDTLVAMGPDERSRSKLVHGVVTGQGPLDGVKFDHAWVETATELPDSLSAQQREQFELYGLNVNVIDRSNGLDVDMPTAVYYSIGQVDKSSLRRYTADEVLVNLARYGHYGPWEDPV